MQSCLQTTKKSATFFLSVSGHLKVQCFKPLSPFSHFSIDLMDRANSRFRIMIMLFMMGFCVVGSVYAIAQGKKSAAAHTNSVHQQNTERYARLKDKEK